jgi:DNA repair photolyase
MISQPALFEEFEPRALPSKLGRVAVGARERSNVLSKGGAEYLGCDYSLNPYVGCGFACTYCYAAFFVADEAKREDWGHWVDVKIDAERQIAKANLKGASILMATATDAYQPLEAKVEITRRIVELLSDPNRQPRLFVQTRSPIVTRDIDLFRRFSSIRVNMSITTDSDEIRKRFEPSCASIERRFEAIAEIKAAGIPIGVSICPILPMEDPESFAKRIAALEPDNVFASKFHHAKREFQASTRQPALTLAKEMNWTDAKCDEAREILRKHLPLAP